MYMTSEQGQAIAFEVEAYMVREMRVPLLLGEDFQTAYEISVVRKGDGECTLVIGQSGATVSASSSQTYDLGFEVKHVNAVDSARLPEGTVPVPVAPGLRVGASRRFKKADRKKKLDDAKRHVTASIDVLLSPGSVHLVPVEGNFEGCDQWLVEKVLISTDDGNVLAAPSTLISTDAPKLPIANPTARPWFIRKGDIVGKLRDPAVYADKPKTQTELEKMVASAEALERVIKATTEAYEGSGKPPAPAEEDGEEIWEGPKTVALDEADKPPVDDVAAAVNLGPDIPDDFKQPLASLLRKHECAFGVGGRLGSVQEKASIPTKPDAQPVSLPMYAAYPAKREVIDKQMDVWFERDVIEPSSSPWGAPCVVVFRNGKARLAVDYRKLNMLTVPDEFPIPRQSDIVQALSGAQVLSSFDALAGFNQVEMEEGDWEKTAFRSHRGLWQFKRMPFGLRNGPYIFQRIMQCVLSPFLWLFALVYIDDIVVFSKSWKEHLEHLDLVLGAIAKSGITLEPKKCYLGYNSILLLGQKVFRLGLSTHKEKVAAVQELEWPSSVHDLQKFMGMVNYFASYIPNYAFIMKPLYGLLAKGSKWEWRAEHERAFLDAKDSLSSAPVLGHPVTGQPYRLYTDASDYAIGASLQQVQPIRVGDLQGTPIYERLKHAHELGLGVPKLFATYSKEVEEVREADVWGSSLDESEVHVERVICYWSRTLKSAERNYSATEREALGAKEALIKFQPFIEGKQILLVTDHSALQWSKSFDNANRRLAAWGAVFSAFPGMKIVHRPGRIHSNVDPLSRLAREREIITSALLPTVPDHSSPLRDDLDAITPDEEKRERAEREERKGEFAPAQRAAFLAWWWDDVVEKEAYPMQTRGRKRREEMEASLGLEPAEETRAAGKETQRLPPEASGSKKRAADATVQRLKYPQTGDPSSSDSEEEPEDQWRFPVGVEGPAEFPEEDWNKRAHLLVSLDPAVIEEFRQGYLEDKHFQSKYKDSVAGMDVRLTPSRFVKGPEGLLYFIDANWETRLCIPRRKVKDVLELVHESARETAHAGPAKLTARLRELFYWPTLNDDADNFARSCDLCQKIKTDHRRKMGGLRPAHIPARPFTTVSLDLITGLPPSGSSKYTAVLVFVDKLTKYAIMVPTHNELSQEGFAKLFMDHVVNKFGMPEHIIADRDKRWATAFWRSVVQQYGSKMALSSAHHPQTDGQTEILNALIEQMLRAYVAGD
uniref:TY3B-TY3B protein n=1 Tax=Mycena chlorophos TaxID=658473 RepID=A0ABQ0LAD0_MYCCL|nr:TY3B-TY3B protein [Mycena chlorophos]